MEMDFVYSPHVDFFIDKIDRTHGYTMKTFHIHHKYEIYYESSGSRRYIIDDTSYVVHTGDVILIGNNQIHKTEAIGDTSSSRIVVNFSEDYLKDIQSLYPDIDFTSFLNQKENHLITGLSSHDQHMIGFTMNRFYELHEENTEESLTQCKLLLASFLLYLKSLAKNQKQNEPGVCNVTNPMIRDAQSFISEHYQEPLTLNSIASALFISPYHLSRLFKRSLGVGIVEYLKTVRVKAAQLLLEQTEDNINTVSEKCGFSSSAHFRRVFKEVTGLTPQKYRVYFRTHQ